MPNYMIIKNNKGDITIKERKEAQTQQAYLTKEERCFTEILDSEEILEYFNNKPSSDNKRLKNSISIFLNDSKTHAETKHFLEQLDGDIFSKVLLMMEFLDESEKIIDFSIEEIENKENRTQLDQDNKLKLIKRRNNIRIIKDVLISPENEDGLLTEEIIEIMEDEIEKIDISNIKKAVSALGNNMVMKEYMTNIYRATTTAQDRSQLNYVYEELLRLTNNKYYRQSIERMHEKNATLTLSIIAKAVLNNYVKNKVEKLKIRDMYEIERHLAKGVKGLDILSDMDSELTNDINPEVATYLNDEFESELERQLDEKSTVLCFNCTNGYTSKCTKIADLEKKEIQDYPFIIRGYQVYRNERLDKFIVGECENFSTIPHYNRLSTKEFLEASRTLQELFEERLQGEDIITKIVPKSKRI